MAYERVNWKDLPSIDTPLTSENMNKMDEGIWNIENSEEIAKTILNNSGMFTQSTTTRDTSIGQRQSFRIGSYIEGNLGRYCNVEYRFQSGDGTGILQTTDRVVFYKCDIFDQGNITTNGSLGFGYHAQIVGHFAPGSTPQNRILGMYGSALDAGGSIQVNSVGSVSLTYSDTTLNNNKSLIFKAELWQPSP